MISYRHNIPSPLCEVVTKFVRKMPRSPGRPMCQKKREPITCPVCEADFLPTKRGRVTCSRDCSAQYRKRDQ